MDTVVYPHTLLTVRRVSAVTGINLRRVFEQAVAAFAQQHGILPVQPHEVGDAGYEVHKPRKPRKLKNWKERLPYLTRAERNKLARHPHLVIK